MRLPGRLLRLEGAAAATCAVVLSFDGGHPWWLLLVLALAPDLSIAAYAAGPSVGAATYNIAHTYVLPIALTLVGVLAEIDGAVAVGLVWIAHIGIDRAIGYGLKYPTSFRETHLQRV